MSKASYMRCPRCAQPTANRPDFVNHVRLAHAKDLESSTMKHGVRKYPVGGAWYSVSEAAYSDGFSIFESESAARRRDDRHHTHMLCVYPDAQPNPKTEALWA